MELTMVARISSRVCVRWGNFHSSCNRSLIQIASAKIYATAGIDSLKNLNLVPKAERVSTPSVVRHAFVVNQKMIAPSLWCSRMPNNLMKPQYKRPKKRMTAIRTNSRSIITVTSRPACRGGRAQASKTP